MRSRKAMRVGMDMIPKAPASSASASVSTLPKTIPGRAVEASSKTGANIRHGPHQDAQKSTITMSLASTVSSKLSLERLTAATDGLLSIPLGVQDPTRSDRSAFPALVTKGPRESGERMADCADGVPLGAGGLR